MKLSSKVLAYGLALALEGTVAYATSLPVSADLSLDGINTEVQNQGTRITGLETRTTNNEQAITTLDNQAGITSSTPASTDATTTPSAAVKVPVTTAAPAPAAPTTKTVTSVEPKMVNASSVPGYNGVIAVAGKDVQMISCTYGFDDGSSETLYGVQNGFTGDPHSADGTIKLEACFAIGHVVNL